MKETFIKNELMPAVFALSDILVARHPDTPKVGTVPEMMQEAVGYIKALQDRITELERCCDEANAHCAWAEEDGKKWKARFEWLAKATCNAVSCGEFRHCNNGCRGLDTWDDAIKDIIAFIDKEMWR